LPHRQLNAETPLCKHDRRRFHQDRRTPASSRLVRSGRLVVPPRTDRVEPLVPPYRYEETVATTTLVIKMMHTLSLNLFVPGKELCQQILLQSPCNVIGEYRSCLWKNVLVDHHWLFRMMSVIVGLRMFIDAARFQFNAETQK
jgi:hypothetical protein